MILLTGERGRRRRASLLIRGEDYAELGKGAPGRRTTSPFRRPSRIGRK